MTTKYIVNNVTGQTINGDITINGNIIVTGTTNSSGTGIYRALLTQTGVITGSIIDVFNFGLIIGETYTITNYVAGMEGQPIDDFSNIANVISGNINETGCVFISTGQTPTNWSNGSSLSSDGDLIVDVLENTLGYDIDWIRAPFGGYGYYVGFNGTTGPLINSFPKNKVSITTQPTIPFVSESIGIRIFSNTNGFYNTNDFINISVFDYFNDGNIDNSLYYTPIEIKIKQDLDTTPILVYGENVSSFPYNNVSVGLYNGRNVIDTFYGDSTTVNDIYELVNQLNINSDTNFLGTYSVNEGMRQDVILTMATNLKNQFSPNNTLTFEVFED